MDIQFESSLPLTNDRRASIVPVIRVEWLAYAALLALALVLRLADLDSTPLFATETHNALAAWRLITPNAAGEPLIASSSLVFTLQSLSFGLFGGKELTARLATALGGAALIFVPLLFRPLLGRARTFLTSLLLALSPVLLVASRSSSPDVWALLLSLLLLWALWRAADSGDRYASLAVILFGALVFLVGAGGLAMSLILVAAAYLTSLWRRRAAFAADDADDAPPLAGAPADALASLPGRSLVALRRATPRALPLAALVVLAVATGFMLYPAGLSAVGEGIGSAVRAVIQPGAAGGYAAEIALFYEPVLWLLAAASLLLRRDRLTTLDVFLASWVLVGVIVSLFFGDGLPDHALWLTVPLAALAANALLMALVPDDRLGFIPPPSGARWVVAASLIGVLCVFTLSFQALARSMVQAPQPALTMIQPPADSVVLVLVSLLFMVIGYFLFASLWGSRTSWQGIALGLVIFGSLTSLGAGWHAAVAGADNPVVFWHTQATSGTTPMLRATLYEISDRTTGGWPNVTVAVMAPQDGVLAWLLRDFEHTRFINNPGDASDAEVILLPKSVSQPQFSTAYLGQKFIISRTWDASTVTPVDFPGWWTQGDTRSVPGIVDDYVLWLRQDVYEGLDQGKAVG